ncbi:MAG: MiaB/RimO family radical SAM methylthiotransferase [Anaerolineales bacterium]|nr:MiaB/RimO family radical SAM methylthiotransferase [Anaerolineales bacterium]
MKVYLDTIGCRLNQSEIERFGREFRRAGVQLTARPEDADLGVINTCAVTARASSDSRTKARQVAERVGQGIILTGCWSTVNPRDASSMPNVLKVISNAEKGELVPQSLPVEAIKSEKGLLAREPLPGLRSRTRAFIKVQDGCDLHCTYCITTIARGAGRSMPTEQIVDDIQYARRGGAKEAVLTGVHLGSWGSDLDPAQSLEQLLHDILNYTDIPRLRLSSIEPWDLNPELFSLWENPRLCRHLHLPIQSGSDRILRRMARRTTIAEFTKLVAGARNRIPDLAITTDIIVGFPGESDQDFERSRALLDELSFSGGHIFTYSERKGTAAARFRGRVPTKVRKQRSALLRAKLQKSAERFRIQQLDTPQSVLWEGIAGSGPQGFELRGWTDNYIRVQLTSPRNLSNEITRVRLQGFSPDRQTMQVEVLD